MLKDRLQILIRPDQRVLLEREAKRREVSVGQVVRDAVDADLKVATPDRRREALERLLGLRSRNLTVEQMNQVVEQERERGYRELYGPSAD